MNGYKKIFRSREVRTKILKFLSFVPDSIMLKAQYYIKHQRKLNLKNPERFTEKLQWYKINYRDPLMLRCTDKAEVRKVIKEWGIEDTLTECYGVFSSADEIDFDSLPDSFVLKSTLGGGGNSVLLVPNKKSTDIETIKNTISRWTSQKRSKKSSGREWAYKREASHIIAEQYLEDSSTKFSGVNDYKFLCFNGKVKYVVFDCDRFVGHKRAIYDAEWRCMDVGTDCEKLVEPIDKPEGFEEMKAVAEKLSEKFPFVRVDLYYVKGKVYFGELTFYPWSGYVEFQPDSFDKTLGDCFILPKKVREK